MFGFIYSGLYSAALPLDYPEALRCYKRAAGQDELVNARASLGNMYSEGRGVPQDYVRAHMWFNLALAASDPDERYTMTFTSPRTLTPTLHTNRAINPPIRSMSLGLCRVAQERAPSPHPG